MLIIPLLSICSMLFKIQRNYFLPWNIVQEENSSGSSAKAFSSKKKGTHMLKVRAKFCAAQIVLALEYLHNRNIVYRE